MALPQNIIDKTFYEYIRQNNLELGIYPKYFNTGIFQANIKIFNFYINKFSKNNFSRFKKNNFYPTK